MHAMRPKMTSCRTDIQRRLSVCSASYVAANVALLAFAADRRAAVDMDRKAAAPAVQQSIDIAWPPGPQQQTRRTPWPRRKIGQTDALCRILCEQSHTRARLTTLFPGLPRSAGTEKVKTIWILLKQETVSGSCVSWAVCKSAPRSNR